MILTLDFETEPITDGNRHPEPVGVAVQHDHRPGTYKSWGHKAGGNNCSREDAARFLKEEIDRAAKVLVFNAGFDPGVARRLGVEIPWEKLEDVQVLAFLADPYAPKRDLKTFAHVELGMAPDEQEDLHRWIRLMIPEAKRKKRLGAYYHLAPGDLVGRYARGDDTRTYRLWRHWRRFRGRAFEREMALLPVLEDMTAGGIPIDLDALALDLPAWRATLALAEEYLRGRIGDVDLDRHEQVADALERAGLVSEWIETAKGRRSLSYDNLAILVAEGKFDRAFAEAWGYRSVLAHTLRTFAEPWLEAGRYLHPVWNSTKRERDGGRGNRGAVTGRLSSEPNVQNIIKVPPAFDVPWPPLPRMRRYVVAPAGMVLVGADVSQQELRILADFVGPPLSDWYRADPRLDLHARVADEIRAITGLDVGRSRAKTINLAKIYKQGLALTAEKLRCSIDDARTLNAAHNRAVPGVRRWERRLAKEDTFETAGGRTYHHDPERPYKSGNTKIQGSAADQLKEVMVAAAPGLAQLSGRLLLTAHDELLALVPRHCAVAAGHLLAQNIEQTGSLVSGTGREPARKMFDVPMLAETYTRERWQE